LFTIDSSSSPPSRTTNQLDTTSMAIFVLWHIGFWILGFRGLPINHEIRLFIAQAIEP
jgi:hypothetical protein